MLYQKNGNIVNQHIVSIEDRAFLYGDGCFTTARLKAGGIMLWERHVHRLQQAVTALRMNCDIDCIKKDKDHFLKHLANNATGIIKIVVSRGESQRGYALPNHTADIYFYYYPVSNHLTHPVILEKVGIIAETLASSFAPLKGIKTLNRLEQIMLKSMAMQQQWDEALCFDAEQNLVEGISSNCFVFIDGIWHTPDLQCAGIDGIMRREILARMRHYQIPHQVRIIGKSEIPQIDAGFLCNALHPMHIMGQLMLDQDIVQSLDRQKCLQLFDLLQLKELV
ncbi:aminodeoxychorismate lyase [Acinetobacter puyangensis]|uniref:aminodeoxychorismate lyase n=1 Tax=Acinetobacter puyangensis TaxID=1096779 RepID=UPI003A4DA925